MGLSTYHHFTVDVEEYFHPTALEKVIPRAEWDSLPRRSPEKVRWLLETLGTRGILGTFFVLGWLAKREPAMVKEIAKAGHEVASHGWGHRKVTSLTPDEFREDLRRSRHLLEDLVGEKTLGYRAPSFSILPGFEWAFDVLMEEEFDYDSSLFPVRVHPGYGYPSAPRDPHLISRGSGTLVEIPPATLKVGKLNLPAAGGAYLRFFPPALIRGALASAEDRGVPGTLYVHPWELDSEMPSFSAPWRTQLRMRTGIRNVARRVSTLLDRFEFRPMRDTAAEMRSGDQAAG
jgi:polysaccharide deacetylase family protein (PEP-CTERM system associated)